MTKYEREIIKDIEECGSCFIGTMEVQGTKVFKRYEKIRKEFEKLHPGNTLAYDSVNGDCWWV